MKAELGTLPSGDDWAFELKWDGMRVQASCHPSGQASSRPEAQTILRSISGRNITSGFPELMGLASHIGTSAIFDGEMVVFDGDRPDFGRLQHRMHVGEPNQALISTYPAVYIIFDLLELDGNRLLEVDLANRRRLLNELCEDGPAWRVPPLVEGDGQALLDLAAQRGLEGVVAKKLSSRYRPGSRSGSWIKVKLTLRQEFVVGGWLPGHGQLDGQLGSLLVGIYDADGTLHFAGAVGSGLTERHRDQLANAFVETQDRPFFEAPILDRPPVWVEPSQVVEVEYGSWPDGGSLRHPVFIGLRLDHNPADVVREMPTTPPGVR